MADGGVDDGGVTGAEFGVYVHVPFCERRCDYCDFATWTDRAHLMERYVEACVTDLRRHQDGDGGHDAGASRPATSVFFGGGTPSLLPAELLARILDAVPRAAGAEVTVECNPDTVDLEKLSAYRHAGVNRLSFGVQSMVPHVLRSLGRTHDPGNVERAVTWAREAGFDTFNLDVIHGAAGESIDDWRTTLERVLALEPPHVSAYALTVEPGTLLARRIERRETTAPDDDDQAAKYLLADELLTGADLAWYEVSNWARPGHECRHNLLYWTGGDYLGVGCAAHAFTGGRRWWTVRTPERYVDLVEAGEVPEAGSETLDPAGQERERLMLAVRTRRGIPVDRRLHDVASGLVADGLLELESGTARLTARGRLLTSDVTLRLLDALSTVSTR